MKKGYLIYNRTDYIKNRFFANELIRQGKSLGLALETVFTEEMDLNKADIDPFVSFAINRSRKLYPAFLYGKAGVRVFNSSEVSRLSNDKALTKLFLRQYDIPFKDFLAFELSPDTEEGKASEDGAFYETLKENISSILSAASGFSYPFVAKPADGHGGELVKLIGSEEEFRSYLEENGAGIKKLLIERVAGLPGKDLRVYILGRDILAAMLRESSAGSEIRANFSLGGSARPHTLTESEKFLVQKIIKAFPADFIGIDLIYDKVSSDEGFYTVPVFNEIEDAVGCRMLYKYTDIDPAAEYMKYIYSHL